MQASYHIVTSLPGEVSCNVVDDSVNVLIRLDCCEDGQSDDANEEAEANLTHETHFLLLFSTVGTRRSALAHLFRTCFAVYQHARAPR